MASDFIHEHQGFLALNDKEFEMAKQSNPNIRKYAHEFLEYGVSREGYWTRDKFILQMKKAVKIKYPKSSG